MDNEISISLAENSTAQLNYYKSIGTIPVLCHNLRYDFSDYDTTEAERYAKEDVISILEEVRDDRIDDLMDRIDRLNEKLENATTDDKKQSIKDDIAVAQAKLEKEETTPITERDDYAKTLDRLTNSYMANYLNIPKDNLVVDMPYRNTNREAVYTVDEVRKSLAELYNVKIKDEGEVGVATSKPIMQMKMFNAINKVFDTKDYQRFMDLRHSVDKYSCGNISLIYTQNPNAKVVEGRTAWVNLGREVDNPRDNIRIYAPQMKVVTEKNFDDFVEKERPTKKKQEEIKRIIEEEGEYKTVSFYKEISVFDISQTKAVTEKGKDVEELLKRNLPLKENAENFNDIAQALESIDAFSLSRCMVTDNADCSKNELLYQAIKSFADTTLSHTPQEVKGIKSHIAEKGVIHTMETEISAYLICKHIGIEAEDKSAFAMCETMDNMNNRDRYDKGYRTIFERAFDRAVAFSNHVKSEFDKEFNAIEQQKDKTIKKDNKSKGVTLD